MLLEPSAYERYGGPLAPDRIARIQTIREARSKDRSDPGALFLLEMLDMVVFEHEGLVKALGRVRDAVEVLRVERDPAADSAYDQGWRVGLSSAIKRIEAALYGAELMSSWWALWSEDGRLLDLITYDTGPVTEAQARAGLGRAVVPLTGRLEAIDRARLNELRATYPNQQGARS